MYSDYLNFQIIQFKNIYMEEYSNNLNYDSLKYDLSIMNKDIKISRKRTKKIKNLIHYTVR